MDSENFKVPEDLIQIEIDYKTFEDDFQIGGFIIIKGLPYQILKHREEFEEQCGFSYTRTCIDIRDIFTWGEVFTWYLEFYSKFTYLAVVKFKNYSLIYIDESDKFVTLMDENGETKESVKLPLGNKELCQKIEAIFKEKEECTVVVALFRQQEGIYDVVE